MGKGILEAYRNDDIRPVRVKTPAHQTLVALHRLRSAWVGERTARLNTIRGLLRELGVFIPVGARKVLPDVWAQLADADPGIPDAVRPFLAEACEEVRDIERRIALVERQLEALAEQLALEVAAQRLASVRADSVMARSSESFNARGRRYVCSPSRSARLAIATPALGRQRLPPDGAAFGRASPMAPPRGRARAGASPLHPG